MSTHDVPGSNPANKDELAMGCWAEHDDGSLILVENTEGKRVIYSVFDISKDPPVEYRDAMPAKSFKKTFSWDDGKDEKWLWHDKTPFPWDRVIKAGAQDGGRFAFAGHLLSAAERVARSLKLKGAAIARDEHHSDQEVSRLRGILNKIADAVGELRE